MSYLKTLRYDPTLQIHGGDEGCYFKGELALGGWQDALGDVLGFCGCGDPEEALRYVMRVLRAVNTKAPDAVRDAPWSDGMSLWNEWYHTVYRPTLDAIFHGDRGAEYFAFYLLTDKELLEHGGSVPGWLTPLGEDVLADLEEKLGDEA
jgi:hypothetical protein